MTDQKCCQHLRELLDAETEVIKKHISNHKWFNHIPSENEGIMDFIKKYGWIMREMYCNYACQDRGRCPIKDYASRIVEDKNE